MDFGFGPKMMRSSTMYMFKGLFRIEQSIEGLKDSKKGSSTLLKMHCSTQLRKNASSDYLYHSVFQGSFSCSFHHFFMLPHSTSNLLSAFLCYLHLFFSSCKIEYIHFD